MSWEDAHQGMKGLRKDHLWTKNGLSNDTSVPSNAVHLCLVMVMSELYWTGLLFLAMPIVKADSHMGGGVGKEKSC